MYTFHKTYELLCTPGDSYIAGMYEFEREVMKHARAGRHLPPFPSSSSSSITTVWHFANFRTQRLLKAPVDIYAFGGSVSADMDIWVILDRIINVQPFPETFDSSSSRKLNEWFCIVNTHYSSTTRQRIFPLFWPSDMKQANVSPARPHPNRHCTRAPPLQQIHTASNSIYQVASCVSKWLSIATFTARVRYYCPSSDVLRLPEKPLSSIFMHTIRLTKLVQYMLIL